jgi:hypothetical protein
MEEALINCQQTFIANNQAAEIARPGKGPSDLPTTFVARPHFIRLFSFIFLVPPKRPKQTYTPASKLVTQICPNRKLYPRSGF